MMNNSPIIVALDNVPFHIIPVLISNLAPYVYGFKFNHIALFHGLHNFTWLKETGKHIMIDLKLHDIPNTNSAILRHLINSGIAQFSAYSRNLSATVHISNDVGALKDLRIDAGHAIDLLGITVLTSFDTTTELKLQEEMVRKTKFALEAGIPGIVCHPNSIKYVDQGDPNHKLIRFCPAIRKKNQPWANFSTPKQALTNGADYLIIGRPIVQTPNPVDSIKRILDEINE